MAKRINLTQHAGVRQAIQATQIAKRLEKHVNGEIELTATQVAAARILLGKTVPDLSSVELTGDAEKPVHVVSQSDQELIARYTTQKKDTK
jgi:hypothetical protein